MRHLISETPRVMVADGSRMVRQLITNVLKRDIPEVNVVGCESIEQVREALAQGPVDLATTSLSLKEGTGLDVARAVRESAGQAYVPVIVVSGDAQKHLEERRFSENITDYFDKKLGHEALAAFIHGYVKPEPVVGATVLYVEDSRVAAKATMGMLERNDIGVVHVVRAEDAIELLAAELMKVSEQRFDMVLTDVTLKGELSGRDIIKRLRVDFGYGKEQLPIIVMTGDENKAHQAELIKMGANDLILKPFKERQLVTKVLFQLRLTKINREHATH